MPGEKQPCSVLSKLPAHAGPNGGGTLAQTGARFDPKLKRQAQQRGYKPVFIGNSLLSKYIIKNNLSVCPSKVFRTKTIVRHCRMARRPSLSGHENTGRARKIKLNNL